MLNFRKWIAVAAAAVLGGGALPAIAADKIEIRLAHHMPLIHHMHRGAEEIAKYFNERSKTHEIRVFGAGQLYNEKALVQAVQTGGVEMSFTTVGFWSGTAPSVLAMDYPLLLGTYERGRKALEGKFGEALASDIRRSGVEVLGWLHFGTNPVIINNKKPIKTVEDFKGLRLRSPNPMGALMFESLGAAAVVISASEVYLAMQRGTLDGTLTGSTAVTQRKFYEVGPYATYVPLQYSAHPVTVNGRFWRSLPPDQQQLLREAVAAGSKLTAQEAEREDANAVAEFSKVIQVHRLDKTVLDQMVKVATPAADKYVKDIAGDRGLAVLELAREDIAGLGN
jgi:TRAP-type C4-dicarboxylate transport system substrate-binding protein